MEGINCVLKSLVCGMILLFVTLGFYDLATEKEGQEKVAVIKINLVVKDEVREITRKYAYLRSEYHHKIPQLQSIANMLASVPPEPGTLPSSVFLLVAALAACWTMLMTLCLASAVGDL